MPPRYSVLISWALRCYQNIALIFPTHALRSSENQVDIRNEVKTNIASFSLASDLKFVTQREPSGPPL